MHELSLAELASDELLESAFERVLLNDEQDGALVSSVARMAKDRETELARISAELKEGRYQPRPVREVLLPKNDGGFRRIQVAPARDRVVERAISVMAAPLLDAHFTPWSFAYRQGLGVLDAVQRIATLRNEGFQVVGRADVHDCFDNVPVEPVTRAARSILGGGPVMEIIDALVRRPSIPAQGPQVRRRLIGVGQGGPLAPVLANLHLDAADRRLLLAGVVFVRYADDVVVLGHDEDEVKRSLEHVRNAVERGGQRLNEDQIYLTTFDEGFAFLGEEFTARYPTVIETHRRSEPTQRTLYVGRQGSGVRVSRGRLIVEDDDTELLSAPCSHVARVVLSGSVGFSAGARSWAMANDVDVVLLSKRGNFLGTMSGAAPSEAAFRRQQYRLTSDNQWSMAIARRMLYGKLSNQRTLLLRFMRGAPHREVAEAAEEIAAYRSRLDDDGDPDTLMGLEGIASRRYWDAFKVLLPDGLGFEGRNRQPPPDVVNAALGYGYAIALGQATSACIAVGLDASAGLLHADHERRPSLALDILEEFRPVIVDSPVMMLARSGRLTTEHGRADDRRPGGVLLTEEGRRRVVAAIENRLLTVFKHIPSGNRVTYRRAFTLQAWQVGASVRDSSESYDPVLWR